MISTANVIYGTKVRYGLSEGEVIRTERKYGINGVVIYEPGSCYSRWVPLTDIEIINETATNS